MYRNSRLLSKDLAHQEHVLVENSREDASYDYKELFSVTVWRLPCQTLDTLLQALDRT